MTSVRKQLLIGIIYNAFAKYSGMFVNFVVAAILARILTAEEFGVVAIATVIITFFGIFSDFGFQAAIIQYKDLTKKDLSNIFSFTVWSGIVLASLFYLLSEPISNYYKSDSLKLICQILSVNLLFSTLNIVPNALFYRDKLFKYIALRGVIVQFVGGSASVIAALLGFGIYSLLITPIFSSVVLFIISYIKYPLKFTFTFGIYSIKRIFSFSAYQFLFNFINYFTRNLDKLIVGKFIGITQLGFYEKSYRLMMLPLQNITYVVTPIMHPIFSDMQNDYKAMAISYEKVIRLLAFIGFPLSVLLFFSAKEVTFIIFGSNWLPSVRPFEILAISVGVQIISSTSGSLFQATHSTKILFISGLFSSTLIIVGLILSAIIFQSVESVAWALTISYPINFILTYYLLYNRVFKRKLSFLLKQLYSPVILTLILVLISVLLVNTITIDNDIISLIVKSVVIASISLAYIHFSGEMNLKTKINEILRSKK